MPVGRHRKPFSSKQKKDQLQAKRERKRNANEETSSTSEDHEARMTQDRAVRKLNEQPTTTTAAAAKQDTRHQNQNRFNLYFLRESKADLDLLKKDASRQLFKQPEESLEFDIDEVYKPDSPLDIPQRPAWNYRMSKNDLEEREKAYFKNYLDRIFSNFDKKLLSYFELNLETWRQLWRVLEISDIILIIVDARFPILHFSPVFYDHVTNKLKKQCILILNKVDLIPPELVVTWKNYFQTRLPSLHIITFTSLPKVVRKAKQIDADLKRKRQIYAIHSHRKLYECVENIISEKTRVDLDSWNMLIDSHLKKVDNDDFCADKDPTQLKRLDDDETVDECETQLEAKQYITIGCCGFPNVGKSSLLNTLVGRKVVSVSRTPGHTKHLQTIFLTPNVRLCDCPGLVFPSLVPKPLQIISGIYPIAQIQEPYSVIRYLAERVDMVRILNIEHPEKDATEYSPLDICEAWALKRRYFTAKAARPDVYRAANEILRMALDGRLFFYLRPKFYSQDKAKWLNNQETVELQTSLSAFGFGSSDVRDDDEENEDDDDDDDTENRTLENIDANKNSDDASNEDDNDIDNDDEDEDDQMNRYAILSNIEND